MDDIKNAINPEDFVDDESYTKTPLEYLMDANREKEAAVKDAKRKAADEDILRVFREAERRRVMDAAHMREELQKNPDALVKAAHRAKAKKADGVSVNINGAEKRNMRVRMEVSDGNHNSPVTLSTVCSVATFVLVGAMFALRALGVM